MPKSAPGNSTRRVDAARRRHGSGFTLIELLVVITIIAISSAVAGLALRDPRTAQLEREAARLGALLESARSEARSAGLAARWQPRAATSGGTIDGAGFSFVGLPSANRFPSRWLDGEVRAEVVGATSIVLGPEPLIGAQRIVLRLGDQRLTLATDGLEPFTVADDAGRSAR